MERDKNEMINKKKEKDLNRIKTNQLAPNTPETEKQEEPQEQPKQEKKSNSKWIFIIVFVLVAIAGFRVLSNLKSGTNTTGNVIIEDFYDKEDFYQDYCNCLEWERRVCIREGYVYDLDSGFCVNTEKGTFTNPVLECSRYYCAGDFYQFNQELNKWKKDNG